jgi:serine/threonine-protein kinase
MKPTTRRRLGKYVLLGRLGHGGMGKIYLGYAPGPAGIEKLLVVKRLHSHLTGDPVLVNSFLDEARLSMALNHPNIVHTYDVGEVDGRYFMVMEYIEGQNLGVVLRTAKRSGVYPSSALWSGLFLSVLDGLHAAHIAHDARGRPLHIIHRDVSPQNVLVTYEGLPKLVDFGIAKAAMRVSETDAGVLKGKYAYMSPEQVRGEPLDVRSDVFAAGIVLWEMLAGRRLYKADTLVRSVERILTEQPISPMRVNADCDPELAKVAFKALQKDKEHRFTTALEMKEALDDALRKIGARTRQSEVRDLMHRLFGDVIQKQHAVLEQCLAQGDAPIVNDDVEEPPDPKRASDSESDVSMLQLRASHLDYKSEITTPSAMRAAPLVTAEGEKSADEGATSLRRKTRGSGASAGLVVDQAANASEPPPRPRTPAEASAAVTGPVIAETTKTNADPPRRSRAPVLIAAAVLLSSVAALVLVVLPRLEAKGDARDDVVTSIPPGPRERAPEPAVTKPAPNVGAPAHLPPLDPEAPPDAKPVEAAPVEAAPVEDRPVEVKPAEAQPVVATPPPDEPRPVPDRIEKRPGWKKPVDKRNVEKVPEKDKQPEKQPDNVDDKALAGEMGTLSLDTVPWTVVYLGKKKLGETPLVKVPVPAGPLELTLVNPEENVREAYVANVKPGQDYKARLDLH